jgi:hypothetical protein
MGKRKLTHIFYVKGVVMDVFQFEDFVMEDNVLEKIAKSKNNLVEGIKDMFKISFTSLDKIEKELIDIRDELNSLKDKSKSPSLKELLVSGSTYRNLCHDNKPNDFSNEIDRFNKIIQGQTVLGITRFLAKHVLGELRSIVDNTYLSGGRFKQGKNISTFYKEVDKILDIDKVAKDYTSRTYPKPIPAPPDLVHKNIGFSQPGGVGKDLIDPSDFLGCKRTAIHTSTPPNKGNNIMYIWEHVIELYPYKEPKEFKVNTLNAKDLLHVVESTLKLIKTIKSFDRVKSEIQKEAMAAIKITSELAGDIYADEENRAKNGPLQTFLFMFYWSPAPFYLPLYDIVAQAEKSVYATSTFIDKNAKLLK